MVVTLLGRRWRLVFKPLGRQRCWGFCDQPSKPNKEIQIDNRIRDCHQLEILLHEMLHACDWQKDEEIVTQQARDMARVLWKLGYRRHNG